jgi:hypothetical protein
VPDEDPPYECGTVARVREALTGGTRALARDRDLAAYLASRVPRADEPVRAAIAFHRRAARWAVSMAPVPAASVLFAACGLPPPGRPLHADAAEASPSARYCYCDGDPKITEVNRRVLAEPGRITVMTAYAAYPATLLGRPQAAELLALGPVSVHVLGAAHYWPADLAAAAVAGYGERLPSGSTLCLTWGLYDATPEGEELTEIVSLAGGRVHRHEPGAVAGWVKAAGMALHPQGITAAAAFAAPYAAPAASGMPMTVMGAVAAVP